MANQFKKRKVDYAKYDGPLGLCLTRKVGEQIVLERGDTRITVTLVDTARFRARIAVNTDKSWNVYRKDAPPGAIIEES